MERALAKHLIKNGPAITSMMKPSAKLFSENADVTQAIAELSLLSSRQEYWECFVCLMGFAHEVRSNPDDILLAITVATGRTTYPDLVARFLDYCKDVEVTSDVDAIFSSANIIKRIDRRAYIGPHVLLPIDSCYRLYPNDPDKVLECVKKGG